MPALSLDTMWLRQMFVNSMSVVDSVEKVELDSDLERQKFERSMLSVDCIIKVFFAGNVNDIDAVVL